MESSRTNGKFVTLGEKNAISWKHETNQGISGIFWFLE